MTNPFSESLVASADFSVAVLIEKDAYSHKYTRIVNNLATSH